MIGGLPTSKGNAFLESPVGEGLQEFFYRYMDRKKAMTGWRGGYGHLPDKQTATGAPLEAPFVSLFEALEMAGFAETRDEAMDLMEQLAGLDPRVGVRRTLRGKTPTIRYWLKGVTRRSF